VVFFLFDITEFSLDYRLLIAAFWSPGNLRPCIPNDFTLFALSPGGSSRPPPPPPEYRTPPPSAGFSPQSVSSFYPRYSFSSTPLCVRGGKFPYHVFPQDKLFAFPILSLSLVRFTPFVSEVFSSLQGPDCFGLAGMIFSEDLA